jgi:hypothetical protein
MSNQPAQTAPVLQAIIPLEAVPESLRFAVTRLVGEWGYSWADVTFAGTARVPHRGRKLDDQDQWVLAITAGPLQIGDELASGGGHAAGVGVSRFSGGVIPTTPYQAYVYERLGAQGRGPAPEHQSPPPSSTPADTAPGAPDLRR